MPDVAAAEGTPDRAPLRLAVTGTDTGVGKTVVTCALVAALRAAGRVVRAMKPVETGVGPLGTNGEVRRAWSAGGPGADTDGARLWHAAGRTAAPNDVCPVTYAEPLAPLVAAERAGRAVDLARVEAARERLDADADALVVEGAGGLLVPYAREARGRIADLATLAERWALGVVVVAADRLGALNHTLLTVREAERRGLTVRLVVLNALRPAPADVAESTNLAALRALLPEVWVLPFPFMPPEQRDDLAGLAALGRPLVDALRSPFSVRMTS